MSAPTSEGEPQPGVQRAALTPVRQRKPAPVSADPAPAAAPSQPSNSGFGLFRALLLVALLAAAAVAYLTSGERNFSMKALSAYDGSNESLPVYLSIDGVVYDVSANRRVYGKGGSYNMM